ncbi:MAG: hypothetical protein JNJ77_12015 [Planctomycetia bacterium]|nr:hypothetical protein [Planctomycetia bacterium]
MIWSVLGIRHHGPGCARSLVTALDELQPDLIVMEGPADAEGILSQAAHTELKPPVAMLLYPPDEPRRGVYYPLAEFSPEWQAMQWAHRHQVKIRLMDLPQSHQLAEQEKKETEDEASPAWRTDPIAVLAQAAGFADHELWWEEQIERRQNAVGLFQGILEAMSAVREEYPETSARDQLREAWMRQTLRQIRKLFPERAAIICGAYHAPVLTEAALKQFPMKEDAARLKGLPKTKVVASWIPWSYSRLSYRSGYGAGMHSPGWYATVWKTPDATAKHWITQAARLMRQKDLEASAASTVETLRLAETLAAMRELRSPGLVELNDAIETVLCQGHAAPLKLIREQLEVGDVVGEVPDELADVPLSRDLEQQTRTLRLKRSSEKKTYDLDLRKPNDQARSALFHRLDLLRIEWACLLDGMNNISTFHEPWQLVWKPELAVQVIEASLWGNTVEQAACIFAIDQASKSSDIKLLSQLLNNVLLARLPEAVDPILHLLQNQAALATDVQQLMKSLPTLASMARYSDVRQTQAAAVIPILEGMFERIVVGVIPACHALDDEAAQVMLDALEKVEPALHLLQRTDLQEEWHALLGKMMQSEMHGLLRGWATRQLLDKNKLSEEDFHRTASLSLSRAVEPVKVAHWLTGLLRGSAMLLLHQDELWHILDRWLMGLNDATFQEQLPLLRRAFADFTGPERRSMGEKVRHLGSEPTAPAPQTSAQQLDLERARLVLPILKKILQG